MKKQVLLTTALVLSSGVATAEMTAMNDNELSAITGKDSISIVGDIGVTIPRSCIPHPIDVSLRVVTTTVMTGGGQDRRRTNLTSFRVASTYATADVA